MNGRWSRQSIRTILLNPRIAGLSAYRGEIVGKGDWEPLVAEETWRAVRERTVIARLSAPDAADLVAVPEGEPDVAGLREEAAAIRRNLEEMAQDRALGLMTQMIAGTGAANIRLTGIDAELAAW